MHCHQRSVVCDWNGVWDQTDRRYLDLSDPFVSDAAWKDLAESETPFENQPCSLCHQVSALCEEGRFEEAQTLLQQAPTHGLEEVCVNRFRDFRLRIAQGQRAGRRTSNNAQNRDDARVS